MVCIQKLMLILYSKENKPTEYFCTNCVQLRLSCVKDKSRCENCGSTEIIPGSVGQLNKQALLKHYGPKED